MNRSPERWKEWHSEPMPNIGIMLIKGNERTVAMYDHAWSMYLKAKPSVKKFPGKDQNKVVEAMKQARRSHRLQWEYFPNSSAVLIDKLYKFVNISIELGGELAAGILSSMDPPTVAIHTTCYEQRAKVMGLKALSAFWTPQYYSSYKKTITKQLLFYDVEQVSRHIHNLFGCLE
jgi:hypothetical protein